MLKSASMRTIDRSQRRYSIVYYLPLNTYFVLYVLYPVGYRTCLPLHPFYIPMDIEHDARGDSDVSADSDVPLAPLKHSNVFWGKGHGTKLEKRVGNRL